MMFTGFILSCGQTCVNHPAKILLPIYEFLCICLCNLRRILPWHASPPPGQCRPSIQSRNLPEGAAAFRPTAQPPRSSSRDNELLMGFLRQRDEDGAQYAMAAHIRHTINLLDQAGLGSV